MVRVDHIDQSRPQEVIVFWLARAVLDGQDLICTVSKEIIQNPAPNGEKIRN